MKSASLVAFGLSLTLFAVAGASAGRTWIGNVTLVSPERLDHIEKGGVLIEDGRIVAVERGDVRPPEGAAIVDGKGGYLVPGLIDSHVHIAITPGAWNPKELGDDLARAYYAQVPRSFLYYGYTTLVDLAVFNRQAMDDFRQAALHPDLLDCGPGVAMANGYPMVFFPPEARFRVFPNFLIDPEHPDAVPPGTKPEEHTPEALVARVKAAGAICVKVFVEPGFGPGVHLPMPTPAMLAAIRAAATKAGLVMVVHANRYDTQRVALDAGADVIAHGMWNWAPLDGDKDAPAKVRALLDRVIAAHTGYQPTFRVLYGESAYFDPTYLELPELRKVVPAAMIEWFKSPAGQGFRKEITPPGATEASMRELYERLLDHDRAVTEYLDRKGGNLVFGTDTPSAPTYGNLPGLNGYLEMKEWKSAGLSLERIFRAATLDNARRFNLDKEVGSIEPGKAANFVLMEKSPLVSLDAYDSIVTVWIRGKPVAREALAANPAPPSLPAAR